MDHPAAAWTVTIENRVPDRAARLPVHAGVIEIWAIICDADRLISLFRALASPCVLRTCQNRMRVPVAGLNDGSNVAASTCTDTGDPRCS
jgi:hypothetical protein